MKVSPQQQQHGIYVYLPSLNFTIDYNYLVGVALIASMTAFPDNYVDNIYKKSVIPIEVISMYLRE